ncbi:glycosyltransferase family 87 protein [Planctomycetota bacterium]
MLRDRPYFPAILIAAILAAQMGAVQVWRLASDTNLSYVTPYFFGLGYHDFYEASQTLLAGKSPYNVGRYVTPPIPAILNAPLTVLPFERAVWVVAALVLVAMFLAYCLSAATFFRVGGDEASWLLVLGVIVVLLSYPFYFLFERGNIDGFVLAAMMLGVWWSRRRPIVAGLCVALAITTKVYPLLLLAPLITHRRYKVLVVTFVALVVALAVAPRQWLEFVVRTLQRAGLFDMSENGSILCTFTFIGDGVRRLGLTLWPRTWRSLGVLAYVTLFMAASYADHLKRDRRDETDETASTLLYFPFMVAMPQQAYHYSLVVLIPLIPAVCYYWHRQRAPRSRRILLLIAVGIALSQWQAVALSTLVGNIVPHVIPGAGLLLVLLGVTWYKVRC